MRITSRITSSPTAFALVLVLGACASPSTQQSAPVVGVMREADLATPADGPFFEFQVEKPVVPAPGGCAPKYPVGLRTSGTTGEVQVLFVVDTAGMVEAGTFKVVRSSHDDFTASVREALACMRFRPASIKGRLVRQWVQQPFTFDIAR